MVNKDPRYIAPEEFYNKICEGDLIHLGISMTTQERSKEVIDAIRAINHEDPGFKYTCECDEAGRTMWSMGYTELELYKQAKGVVVNLIQKFRAEDGALHPDEVHCITPCGETSACSCPFSVQ